MQSWSKAIYLQSSSATVVLFFLVLLAAPVLSFSSNIAYAQMSSDHMSSDQSHIPTANIGNRVVALDFSTTPANPLPSDTIDMNLYLFDKSTNNAIRHVTFNVGINTEDGKQVFLEVVHGHDGKVSIRFVNDISAQTYKVSANYDSLSASYVSDFGNPIKVQGNVFSLPGNYKISIEVTGIDYDNTFLPEPVEYSFILPVTPMQTILVKYQDSNFQLKAYSSFNISSAELFTEKKQLVLHSTDNNATGTFTIKLEIPKEMMSGPFTAAFEDGTQLTVTENSTNSSVSSLIITGQHDSNMSGMNNTHNVVISATNVVPEFPAGIGIAAAALAITGTVLVFRKGSFRLGKTY